MENRQYNIYSLSRDYIVRLTVVATMLFAGWTAQTAGAQPVELSEYTEQRPLKIVCDVRAIPFEFRNDEGQPDGFTVEILKEALDNLGVPYTFVMQDRLNATNTFDTSAADLITIPVSEKKAGVYYTKESLAPYEIAIAHRKNHSITELGELTNFESIALKKGEYAANVVTSMGTIDSSQIHYVTVRQGLQDVLIGEYDYMICGKIYIDAVIKKYKIDGLQVNLLNITPGEIRIASHNPLLIERLNEQIDVLQKEGKLEEMKTKWFVNYGAYDADGESPILLVVIITICVALGVFLLINRLVRKRINHSLQHTLDINNILTTSLKIGNSYVLVTDLKKRVISNLYGEIMPYGSISLDDFFDHIHIDDRAHIQKCYDALINKEDVAPYRFRWRSAIPNSEVEWKTIIAHSILETDPKGEPLRFITTIDDVTNEEQEENDEHETLEIYHHLFEMPLVGLALYDKDGFILEYNNEMRKIFGAHGSNADFNANTCLFDMPAIRGYLDRNDVKDLHYCTMTDFTNNGIVDYVEIKLRPIKDEKGDLRHIMLTARNMEKQRHIYLQSKEHDAQTRAINEDMQKIETELTYLLEQSHMMVWRSNEAKRTVTLYRNLRAFYKSFGYEEFLDIVDPAYRDTAKELIEYDAPHDKSLKKFLRLEDKVRDDGNMRYYAINSIPDYDKKGNKIGRFGLIRDTNDMFVAREKMKREKERADDSSRLKSVFLANMSHEIRTPLNAIVGFCDVLMAIDMPDQRQEFLKIINNNCNLLIQLINDILIVSELDSNGLTLEPKETDFAAEFEIVAASLASRVTNPNVQFLTEMPCKKLIIDVDMQRLQQVITNFLTNALKYTTEGHVKIGYRLQDNGLYMYCEDTGTGIPKEKLDKVFGRFVKLNDYVQGAGLGLSICKAIIDRCNGKIAVDSEMGKGSTFWVWIPCEVKEQE